MTNFKYVFEHLKVFDLRMKFFLLQIKIAKTAFLEDCLRKLHGASAFVTISVNAKI